MKGYFIASEEETKVLKKGYEYHEPRLGVFKNKESVLDAEKPQIVKNYPIIVEVDVPDDSVIKHPKNEKFSFGKDSKTVVKRKLGWHDLIRAESLV